MLINFMIDLLITAVGYLLVPVLFCFSKKELSTKKIKWIVIFNGGLFWLVFSVIRINNGQAGGTAAVFLWSFVAYKLMQKFCTGSASENISFKENNIMQMKHSEEQDKKKRIVDATYSEDVLFAKQEDEIHKNEDLKSVSELKSDNKKKRYCIKCGSIIDNKSMKCTWCGKQYYNFMFSVKYNIIITIVIVVLSVTVLSIQQMQKNNTYNEQTKQEQLEKIKSNNPDNIISYDVSQIRVVKDGYVAAGLFSEMISDSKYLIHGCNINDVFDVEFKVIGGMEIESKNYRMEGDGNLTISSVEYGKAKDSWYKVTLPDGKEGYIWGGTDGLYVEEIK